MNLPTLFQSLICWVFVFSFSKNGVAQTSAPAPVDTALALHCLAEAQALYKTNQNDLAFAKLDTAERICSNWPEKIALRHLATIHSLQGNCLEVKAKYKEAEAAYFKSLAAAENYWGTGAPQTWWVHRQLATQYGRRSQLAEARKHVRIAFDLAEKDSTATDKDRIGIYTVIAANEERADANASIAWLKKALALALKKENSGNREIPLVQIYYNLSTAYRIKSDYPTALEYALLAQQSREKYAFTRAFDASGDWVNIGRLHGFLGNHQNGIDLCTRGVESFTKILGEKNVYTRYAMLTLVDLYLAAGNLAAAESLLRRVLSNDLAQFGEKHSHIVTDYQNLAICLSKMGKADEALLFSKKQLELLEANPTNLASGLCIGQNIHAGVFYELARYAEAAEWYGKSIVCSQGSNFYNKQAVFHLNLGVSLHQDQQFFAADSIFEIAFQRYGLDAAVSPERLSDPVQMLNLLSRQSALKVAFAKKNSTPANLETAAAKIKTAENALDVYLSHREKFGKQETIAAAIHMTTEASISLEKMQPQPDLPAIFQKMEKSKASRLLENFEEQQAIRTAEVPSEILAAEKELRLEIAYYESKKFEKNQQQQPELDSSEIARLAHISNLRLKYEDLKKELARRYPKYFKLKYDYSVVRAAEIQRDLLAPDQALIEYFVGDSTIFIFKIGKEKLELHEVKKDFLLERWVTDLRHASTAFFTDPKFSEKYDSLAQVFADRSHSLFQKLVAPVAQNLPPRLVIVPDGVLGLLPFELLLQTPPTALANRFQQHNYLIFKHSISYCPSATMLREMSADGQRPTVDGGRAAVPFFGFAPHFTGDTSTLAEFFKNDLTMRKGLDPLPFSGEEVARLSKIMRGKYLAGADASKTQFLEAAPTAQILHLATHGQANDRAGDYCFLAFAQNSKSETQNSLLFAREIYNLSLNADLVTLSACETGIGQVQTGEGIISLARAFAYAGARSIVTSLWSVSDAKTKDLMLDFYRNLRRGLPKDESLRQAKLDFLKKNKGQAAHPFFWAGFIGIGNSQPLK